MDRLGKSLCVNCQWCIWWASRWHMKIVMRFVCVNAGDGEVECAEHIKSKTCLYNQCESLTELWPSFLVLAALLL